DEQALEIVATLSDEVCALGEASRTIEGRVTAEVAPEGVGVCDEYFKQDEAYGLREAEADAARNFDRTRSEQIENAVREQRVVADSAVEPEASARANEELRRRSASRIEELEIDARRHLQTVGV